VFDPSAIIARPPRASSNRRPSSPAHRARLRTVGDHRLIVRTLDARGLRCPLPLIHARRELATLPAGATLVVLATDPEAPIDLAGLAADEGHAFSREQAGAEWRITLTKGAAGR
jgi:tRNA 2-thiouridine synthesizing protein A